MKKFRSTFLLFLFLAPAVILYATNDDEGFSYYVGYSFGKMSPGFGNIKALTYDYNAQYGADFHYTGFLQGPVFGFRGYSKYAHFKLEWIFLHGKSVSDYMDPVSLTDWTLGIKTRHNSIFMGAGGQLGNLSYGLGMDLSKTKIFSRQAPVADYKSERWDQEDNVFGKKLVIFGKGYYDFGGDFIFYLDYFVDYFGIRLYYQQAMFNIDYSNKIGGYYSFKPNNLGISFCFNKPISM